MAPPITLLKMVRWEDVIDDVTGLKSFENHEKNVYFEDDSSVQILVGIIVNVPIKILVIEICSDTSCNNSTCSNKKLNTRNIRKSCNDVDDNDNSIKIRNSKAGLNETNKHSTRVEC